MNTENLAYVCLIGKNAIYIICEDNKKKLFLKLMGAKREFLYRNRWILKYFSENELAEKLMSLRDHGFIFEGGMHGWTPVDIFHDLKEHGAPFGKIIEIT